MKTPMTVVLALSMMVASAFGAAKQDPTKPTTETTKSTTKAKKHKKASTSASVKPAAAAPVASK